LGVVLTRTVRPLVTAAALLIVGCSAGSEATRKAETITRAVYGGDYETTVADFDAATKQSVTRSQVGALSDRMHALGDFQSLTERTAPLPTGKYEFDAAFTKGTMLVEMRLDPDGKVAAYRVGKL
jgi:hypothetical protein